MSKDAKVGTGREMTLAALKDDTDVTLVHYVDFNHLYVMPVLKDGELIQLADDIQLCQLKQDPMTVPPVVGEVILTKYPMNAQAPQYYRAVVRGVNHDKVLVRMVDCGEQILVNIANCKPADATVLKHPVYTRRVVLDGILDMPPDLMMSRVSKYFCRIANEKLTLKMVMKEEGATSPRMSTPLVKLYRGQGSGTAQQECVNDAILGTGTWFWEKSFLRGNTTDDAIWKDLEAEKAAVHIHEIPIQKVALNEEMRLKIGKFNNENVVIAIPQLPKNQHDFQVFEGQIQKYAAMVGSSPYYPEVDEVLLMRIFGDPSSIWKRAARVRSSDGNMLYTLDYGDMFPLDFCEIRRIPMEFTLVGTFAVYAQIKVFQVDHHPDKISAALKNVFRKDTVHKMKAISIDESTAVVTFICVNLYEKILQSIYGGSDQVDLDETL